MPACVRIVRSVDHFIFRWLGIVKGVRVPSGFSYHRDMIALSHKTEAQALKSLDDFIDGSVHRKLTHQTATPASATKASRTEGSPSKTSDPKVSMWKVMADFTSASASS